MTFIIRGLARYWIIAPVLLVVVGVQIGIGFLMANSMASGRNFEPEAVKLDSSELVCSTPEPRPGASPNFYRNP